MKVRTILSLAAAALSIAGSAVVLNTPLERATAGGDSPGVLVVVDDGTLVPASDLLRPGWDCPDDEAADS
jgi:hypothetical protein